MLPKLCIVYILASKLMFYYEHISDTFHTALHDLGYRNLLECGVISTIRLSWP